MSRLVLKPVWSLGNFQLPVTEAGSGRGSTILVGKITGDEEAQIVLPGLVVNGNGDQLPRFSLLGSPSHLYDVNHDGSMEIVSWSDGNRIAILNGQGTILKTIVTEDKLEGGVRVTDLDNDNKLEVIATEAKWIGKPPQWEERKISLYDYTTGKRKWSYFSGPKPYVGAIMDIDGDGIKELICQTWSLGNGISWNDMTDIGHGYVFALSRDGKRLWVSSFDGYFLGVPVSVSDLHGDGELEVVAATRSWERRYGLVRIIDPRSGRALSQFPPEGPGDFSFTALGIADLDGNGEKEIVCSVVDSTRCGRILILSSHCVPVGMEYRVSSPVLDYDYVNCYIRAINDIDGDAKPEVVVSSDVEKVITLDPRSSYSRFLDPQLIVLNHDLSLNATIPLEERCSNCVIADIIPGSSNELILLSDQLTLYEIEGR